MFIVLTPKFPSWNVSKFKIFYVSLQVVFAVDDFGKSVYMILCDMIVRTIDQDCSSIYQSRFCIEWNISFTWIFILNLPTPNFDFFNWLRYGIIFFYFFDKGILTV